MAFNGFGSWVKPLGSFRPELESSCTWCQREEEAGTGMVEGTAQDNTTVEARVLLERVIVSQIMRSVASMIRVSRVLRVLLQKRTI